MLITLIRNTRSEDSICGFLMISGEKVCDTLEHPATALPPGNYEIVLHRCKQQLRRVPITVFPKTEPVVPRPCDTCPLINDVSFNTCMPCVCPQLAIGNGVRGRPDGSILLGERLIEGTLIHSRRTYERLFERIEKALHRQQRITLRIV